MRELLSLAVIGFLLLCVSACEHNVSKSELENWSNQLDSLSVEIAHDVEIRYSDSGYLKAIITAPLMEHHDDPKNPFTEMKNGVLAKFYDHEGREESNLRAEYAINYEKKKLIHLKKDVHVINTMGEELISEELFWDQAKKEIYTDEQVIIKRGEERITGTKFRSNETFTKYRIEKPIGQVQVPDEIEADSTEGQNQ